MKNYGSETALILIDIQNDFCPGGALEVADGDQIVPLVNKLQNIFSINILTQDWHPNNHKSFASTHQKKNHYLLLKCLMGLKCCGLTIAFKISKVQIFILI